MSYKTPQDFLQKMDTGELDGNMSEETKRLTSEQLEEVAKILMARDDLNNGEIDGMEQPPELQKKKTILVVDDDPTLLKSLSVLLGDTYNVLTASSGEDALRQSKDFKPEIHALLSDFQMPGMTGIELASQITVQRPTIKVLLMSGYPAGMLVLNEGWHFLPKPFIASQLRALIVGLVSPDQVSRFAA